MKLHCPHCGVKGSADDSYSGRKVKCPKCSGIFEVKENMALAEKRFVSSVMPSPPKIKIGMPAALVGQAATEKIVDEKQLVSAETEESLDVIPSEEEVSAIEEVADLEDVVELEESPEIVEEVEQWSDLAAEIDEQLAEEETEEDITEPDEDMAPAALSSLEDEEIVEDIDELSENDEELERELEELTDVEAEPVAELQDEQLGEQDLELTSEEGLLTEEEKEQLIEEEPYGLEKEQCWQCGKQDSVGEPFIAKDGRLYCTDCAPVEDEETEVIADSRLGVAGENLEGVDSQFTDEELVQPVFFSKFSIGDAIRRAWDETKGAKGTIWAASAIMYLVILVIVAAGSFLLPSVNATANGIAGNIASIIFQVVVDAVAVLFTAGLLYIGIRKVSGDPIDWRMGFKGFSCAGKVIVATILQWILITIGFLLLILPGIYLTVGYAMTLPLIVDQDLSPWEAMEKSRKAVHKVWWRVAGLFLAMILIFVVSLVPLGIGLIWTWPMFIILAGVVYRYLFKNQ